MKKRFAVSLFCALTCAVALTGPAQAGSKQANGISSVITSDLPAAKRTPLGRYLTSQDAFSVLQDSPGVLFVDVRDPVEIGVSGHPEGIDAIVPIKISSETYDPEISEYELRDNPYFLTQMAKTLDGVAASKHDMIIITCGSGMRSALAVRALAEQGYDNVWHIVDGYDGEGKRGWNSDNAWRRAGLPWQMNASVPGSEWALLFGTE